jgi:hypothetical protein
VICRRVVTAYVTLVVILLLIFFMHLLRFHDFGLILRGIINLVGLVGGHDRLNEKSHDAAVHLFVLQQSLFLLSAFVCVGMAFWLFARKTSEARTQVG